MTQAVKVECYGSVTEYETRDKAVEHFAQCVFASEGSEQSRYVTILSQLLQGQDFCTDKELDK